MPRCCRARGPQAAGGCRRPGGKWRLAALQAGFGDDYEADAKRVLDEVERRAAAKARAAAEANGQQRKRHRTAPLPPPQGGILSALFGQWGWWPWGRFCMCNKVIRGCYCYGFNLGAF